MACKKCDILRYLCRDAMKTSRWLEGKMGGIHGYEDPGNERLDYEIDVMLNLFLS